MNEYLPENLTGKSVLITGGTTGIGRSTALLLALSGAKILIAGRHQEQIDETIKAVRETAPEAAIYGIRADVSEEKEIERMFAEADSQFNSLDILINNAGLGEGSVTEGEYEQWQYVLNTNLMAYMACANQAVKRMKEKGGYIINVGSMSSEIAETGSSVYVATKAGIHGFSKSFRKEVNPLGIKVTLIEPGAVSTDMQPGSSEEHDRKIAAMEMLKADDIAMSILYCLSQPKRCDIVSLQIRPLKQEI